MSEAQPPDVMGWLVPDAIARLTEEGWQVEGLTPTRPPADPEPEPETGRVARIRVAGEGLVHLTYVKPPAPAV
jgi:hypothetical protein